MSETLKSKAAQKLAEKKRANKEIKEEDEQEPPSKKRRSVYDVVREHTAKFNEMEETVKECFQDQQKQIEDVLKKIEYCEAICKAIDESEKELEDNDTKKKK